MVRLNGIRFERGLRTTAPLLRRRIRPGAVVDDAASPGRGCENGGGSGGLPSAAPWRQTAPGRYGRRHDRTRRPRRATRQAQPARGRQSRRRDSSTATYRGVWLHRGPHAATPLRRAADLLSRYPSGLALVEGHLDGTAVALVRDGQKRVAPLLQPEGVSQHGPQINSAVGHQVEVVRDRVPAAPVNLLHAEGITADPADLLEI